MRVTAVTVGKGVDFMFVEEFEAAEREGCIEEVLYRGRGGCGGWENAV